MIDALGHPITAGCTVITSAYCSPLMSKIVTVKRVTKTKVILNMAKHRWVKNPKTNKWKREEFIGELRRNPYQVLVVDKQLAYNRKAYPEYMV